MGVRVGVRVGVGGWGVIRVGVEGNWVGAAEGGRMVQFYLSLIHLSST